MRKSGVKRGERRKWIVRKDRKKEFASGIHYCERRRICDWIIVLFMCVCERERETLEETEESEKRESMIEHWSDRWRRGEMYLNEWNGMEWKEKERNEKRRQLHLFYVDTNTLLSLLFSWKRFCLFPLLPPPFTPFSTSISYQPSYYFFQPLIINLCSP